MNTMLRYLIVLCAVLLPVSTKVFVTSLIPELYEYAREFSSLFLYGIDVVVLMMMGVFVLRRRSLTYTHNSTTALLILFIISILISVGYVSNAEYSLFVGVHIIVAIIMAYVIASSLVEKIISSRVFYVAIGISATMQGLIACAQFYYQRSVGLWMLGESVITPLTTGIARVDIGGIRFLRVYGTLPHANILASFLVMGIISLAYVYLTASQEEKKTRLMSLTGLFITMVALVLTFSRSGWLVGLFSVGMMVGYGLWKKELRRTTMRFVCAMTVSSVAIVFILWWAIMPRAGFAKGEVSVSHRVIYNRIGLSLIENHPLGVGVGNQVLQGAQEGLYQKETLTQPWLWQPVHNIYILIASELGIVGFLIFIALLFSVVRAISIHDANIMWALFLVLSQLAMGVVDHFPWDLHAGRLMFWASFGILMGLVARSQHRPL
jgi:putative inorganic carbon (hco3(-)) transporter